MRLHTFWRSSAAYRVRIALNLKGIACEQVAVQLPQGEQRRPEYLAANPQGLVPALEHDGRLFVQSLAIIEYLDSVKPEPRLLPADPVSRARVAALAQAIACDLHPLNNLRVLNYLRHELEQPEPEVARWYSHWVGETFDALETWAREYSTHHRFLFGDAVSMADVVLVPQVYNARRFEIPLDAWPTLVEIDAHLRAIPAFAEASPERQPDAP